MYIKITLSNGGSMSYKKTDKLIKYNNEYNKQNYDRISLMLPKGKKALIQQAAKVQGISANQFINAQIDKQLDAMISAGQIAEQSDD